MDLKEWTSGAGAPETKPWLTPVVYSLEAFSISQGGHPSSYGLWASLDDFTLTPGGVSTDAMGSYSGPATIPATQLYDGHTTRFKFAGSITTAGADNVILSIRDTSGVYTYASVTLAVGGATGATPYNAEFDIQINKVGGAGVGKMRSTGNAVLGAGALHATFNISDTTTFDSTLGVDYRLFMSKTVGGDTVTRTLGVASVVY